MQKTSGSKQKELDRIAKEIENCRECRKNKSGKSVPGEGNSNADIIFIGEAPGKQEAKTGRPFVGPAGKVLRNLIKEAGLKDEEIFITSPIKYLPDYVTPKNHDIEHGRIHLFRQFDVIEPKIIVLLGNTAAVAVLHEKFAIAKDHGKIVEKGGKTYLITYHPAATLYNPKTKELIKQDFEKLKKMVSKK